jgi:hypothetical protein
MTAVRTTLALALALAVAVGCSSGEPAANSPSATAPYEPVLEGTYRLDLDGEQALVNGKPMHAPPAPSLFAFRSACSHTGCIATGTLLQGDDKSRATNFVITLDYVRGGWQMVAGNTFACPDQSTVPGIVAWSFKPGADREFAGTYYAIHAGGADCVTAMQAPMTLKRVADVDPTVAVADPRTVPAFSPSAPEGLRGRYTETSTYRGDGAPPTADAVEINAHAVEMTTMCVRNTDECWTLQTETYDGATVESPLTFADGKWSVSRRPSRSKGCVDHANAKLVLHADYPMPLPALDPLKRLAGTEVFDFSSPGTQCAGAYAYDTVLERTGS